MAEVDTINKQKKTAEIFLKVKHPRLSNRSTKL